MTPHCTTTLIKPASPRTLPWAPRFRGAALTFPSYPSPWVKAKEMRPPGAHAPPDPDVAPGAQASGNSHSNDPPVCFGSPSRRGHRLVGTQAPGAKDEPGSGRWRGWRQLRLLTPGHGERRDGQTLALGWGWRSSYGRLSTRNPDSPRKSKSNPCLPGTRVKAGEGVLLPLSPHTRRTGHGRPLVSPARPTSLRGRSATSPLA